MDLEINEITISIFDKKKNMNEYIFKNVIPNLY